MKIIFHSFLYLANLLLALPFLPWFIWQGKRARNNMAPLTDALRNEHTAVYGNGEGPAFQLLVLGESTVAGLGAKDHHGAITGSIAGALSEKVGKVQWYAFGRNGYTLRHIAERILPQTEDIQPDLIVLAIGANDSFTFTSPWVFRRHADLLFSGIQKLHPGAELLVAHMPPIRHFTAFDPVMQFILGNQLDLLSWILKEKVEAYHYRMIDEKLDLKRWARNNGAASADLLSDGVHPSEKGYELWGRRIVEFIKN